jgi:hypothetical protein
MGRVVVEINFVGCLTLVEHVKVAIRITIRPSMDVIRQSSRSFVLFHAGWSQFRSCDREWIILAAVVITNLDLWVVL